MKSNPRKKRLGFTLVELLVVIAIIVILAAIGVGSFGFVQDLQAKEKAKVQMALLSNAIEEYKKDMGEYPGTDENTAADGDVSEELYQALFKDGFDYTNPANPPANWTKATKIYVPELDPRTTKQRWVTPSPKATDPADDLKIIDPWGENYRYRKGTNAENQDFDLWSMGKDKQTDTTNSDKSVEENKDDIRNF